MASADFDPPKFALVSHVLPPSPSGQAVVLYRLLRDLDPRHYCVLSVREYPAGLAGPQTNGVTARLRCNYHAIPDEADFHITPMLREIGRQVRSTISSVRNLRGRCGADPAMAMESAATNGQGNGPTWQRRLGALLARTEESSTKRRRIARRTMQIQRVATREKCTALVVCSGDWIDVPAAHQAARRLRLPLFVYMFDDFPTHSPWPHHQAFAQRVAPRILRDAAGVVVPNVFLADAYRARYGIEPWIIHNPIETPIAAEAAWRPMGQPTRIVYTGAIYEAHFDAFHRLQSAIADLREPTAELHIYTPMTTEYLTKNGIRPPAILHPAVAAEEAVRLQQASDIVFLPLAFDSPIPEIIHTSAPGKMGELLASGRPVLVHVPRESFVSWYFRTHQCGVVVDEKDPALLGRAIERLRAEPEWCRSLVQRARATAEVDFSLATARTTFAKMLAGPPRQSTKSEVRRAN
jgi:glycosyltransferase involved in cell wall biosynthesis